MKFREIILESGTKNFLGRNAENNDELMKKFRGKKNVILHTVASGNPFCVIDKEKPTKKEISEAGAFCARYSQDWRNNKKDVKVHVFTGKDIYKNRLMPIGTFGVKKKKIIIVREANIRRLKI